MNSLVVQENSDLITFDDDKKALIKRTIAKGATDDEFALFMHQAQRTGLDPLAKQIYFQKYKTRDGYQIAIITGIDGYRLVADRTGKYAGNDEPVFDGRIGDYPAKATVTVWKIVAGVRCNFSASVYWKEYYPGDTKGFQWRKMPHVMLAKCAEAAALRKAFPADLSGVYTHDEMAQANLDIVEGEIVPEPSKNSKPPEPEPELAPAAAEILRNIDRKELDHMEGGLEDSESESEIATGTDQRGDSSPQAQAKRERPTAEAVTGVDWEAKALRARKLVTFASAAALALDGYENEHAVIGALNKQSGFEYDPQNNTEILAWLKARKESE